MAHAAARQKLRGVYRYVAEGHDWDIRQIRSDEAFTPETVRTMVRDGIDGCIVSLPNCPDALRELAGTNIPSVAIEIDPHVFGPLWPRLSHLRTDNAGIGRAGAACLRRLGMFRTYAFVPDQANSYWAQARAVAFAEALADCGCPVETFCPATKAAESLSVLGDFLERLPKPVGVMAAWDIAAAQVISACRERKLQVPNQVSVLGVDNDEFICESVTPALSTILVDREKQGYDAAVILGQMIRGTRRRLAAPICRVATVVERESTAPLSPAAPLIKRALRFIEENALRGIRPDDVATRLGVSRRLLDLRFRQQRAGSLAACIRERRLKEVNRLIKMTDLSDVRIAERCGFANVNALRNLYRAKYGRSLRQSRAALKRLPPDSGERNQDPSSGASSDARSTASSDSVSL